MWRGKSGTRRSRHTLHFLTFACSGSETSKRQRLLGSGCLSDHDLLLEDLYIRFFEQFTFSVPRLMQFINTTVNLRFDKAEITFKDEHVEALVYFP